MNERDAGARPEGSYLAPRESAPDTRYEKVGGWLLLFCVALTIINPLGTTANLFYGYTKTSPLFGHIPGLKKTIITDTILSVALMCFSVYAGVRLWKITAGAVEVAKRYLMVYLGYNIFTLALPFIYGIPERFADPIFKQLSKAFPFAAAYFTIWYLYLTYSKRVKGTYKIA